MSKIYERAESVIVWLNDDSLLPVHSVETSPMPKRLARAAQDIKTYARRHYFEFKEDHTRAPHHMVSAFRHLLQHNYFTQIWVVQELCLSTEPMILVEGDVWLEWRRMHDAWTECGLERGALGPAVESMLTSGHGEGHLLHAIESYSGNHCCEPRVVKKSLRICPRSTTSTLESSFFVLAYCECGGSSRSLGC